MLDYVPVRVRCIELCIRERKRKGDREKIKSEIKWTKKCIECEHSVFVFHHIHNTQTLRVENDSGDFFYEQTSFYDFMSHEYKNEKDNKKYFLSKYMDCFSIHTIAPIFYVSAEMNVNKSANDSVIIIFYLSALGFFSCFQVVHVSHIYARDEIKLMHNWNSMPTLNYAFYRVFFLSPLCASTYALHILLMATYPRIVLIESWTQFR